MLSEKEILDLYETLSKTSAKALRELADELETIKTAGDMAKIAGKAHALAFTTSQAASDWMNAERKAA